MKERGKTVLRLAKKPANAIWCGNPAALRKVARPLIKPLVHFGIAVLHPSTVLLGGKNVTLNSYKNSWYK